MRFNGQTDRREEGEVGGQANGKQIQLQMEMKMGGNGKIKEGE